MGALNSALGRARPFVLPWLRLTLGLTMFWHGYKKFDDGLSVTKGFFDSLSIPLPGFFALVVALLELIGGLAILVGLFTRVFAGLFILELLVAVIRYKYGEDVGMIGAKEAGAELDWSLIAGFFVLVGYGGGMLSLDRIAKLDPPKSHD